MDVNNIFRGLNAPLAKDNTATTAQKPYVGDDLLINSLEDFQNLEAAFYTLPKGNPSCVNDLPRNDWERRALVRRLVRAIKPMESAFKDSKPSQAAEFLKTMTEFDIQWISWKLLKSIENAARSQYCMPHYAIHKPAEFDTFHERFDEVVSVLQQNESLAKNIFDDEITFTRRISMNPQGELKRKEQNSATNDRRKKQVRYASEHMPETDRPKKRRRRTAKLQDDVPSPTNNDKNQIARLPSLDLF